MSPFGERQSQHGAASLAVFRGSVTGPKGVWEQNRDLEMEADSRASGPAAVSKIIYNSDYRRAATAARPALAHAYAVTVITDSLYGSV